MNATLEGLRGHADGSMSPTMVEGVEVVVPELTPDLGTPRSYTVPIAKVPESMGTSSWC